MSSVDGVRARIEAALYVSGRPLTTEELARAAGISSQKNTVKAARTVAKSFNSSLDAVEISELSGQRFVMQLKPEYNLVAKKFALKPLMPTSVLRTLSYVVYFQPVTSADMALRRGSQVYQHLKTLQQMGFIESQPSGRTRVYRTTSLFPQHFGLSEQVEEMKRQLAKTARIPKGALPPGH
ncbi:MAG: SMC-Scp complex subunit ScpB [Candidatus Geothermarchaeales archaeon]